MPFLIRLATREPFETWLSMEQAAEQRYWDGSALAASDAGHETGAVYLLGYTVEMLLKTACFRTAGIARRTIYGPSRAHSTESRLLPPGQATTFMI